MVQSCSDVKSIYSKAEDGEYRITLADGNQSLIYCYGMSGTPKEFLSLPAGPDRNFGNLYVNTRPHSLTVYNKVGIDLKVSEFSKLKDRNKLLSLLQEIIYKVL